MCRNAICILHNILTELIDLLITRFVDYIRSVAPINGDDTFLNAIATYAVLPVAVCLVLGAVEAGF